MNAVLPVICFAIGGLLAALIAWWICRGQAQQAAHHARASLATDQAVLSERLQAREQQVAQFSSNIQQHETTARSLQAEVSQLKQQQVQLATTLKEERQQAAERKVHTDERERELRSIREAVAELQQKRAELETTLFNERKQSEEKLALLADAEKKMSDAFKALAAEVLQSNNQSFLDLAKTTLETHQKTATGDLEQRQQAIDALVKPVKESLEKVDAKIQELETKREGAYKGLEAQVKNLLDNGDQLRTETNNLVNALRTPNVRGRWGEIQLRRVVEIAGMIDHCDFYEQQTVGDDEKQLRPDMLIRLPGNVHIVVDSKAPLSAYLDALEAPDDETRKTKMHDHARHVSNHVDQLSKKSYWDQFHHSPEFVILFLPGENFFSAALEHLPSLIEKGVEQRVLIATPMTLISLLRAVSIGWRQERLAKNAEEISQLGKDLYERISKLGEHFTAVGKTLGQAVAAYNNAVGTLEGRVFPAARKFRELGAAGGDELEEIPLLEKNPRDLKAVELLTVAQEMDFTAAAPEQIQRRMA